jgi:hypothetical protein
MRTNFSTRSLRISPGPARKDMPPLPMTRIIPRGLDAQQPFHSQNQRHLRRLHHEVKMIAHQAIRMHLPARLPTSLSQHLQKDPPAFVVFINGFLPISTAHHVVNRPFIFPPNLPRNTKPTLPFSLSILPRINSCWTQKQEAEEQRSVLALRLRKLVTGYQSGNATPPKSPERSAHSTK